VHGRQPGRTSAIVDDLVDPRWGHGPVAANPEVRQVTQTVSFSGPKVAVERLGGLATYRQRPGSAVLAQHPHNPLIQVDIVQGHADAFGPAHASVDQEQDDGGVAAAGESRPPQDFSS
jgi:hypothetical protein